MYGKICAVWPSSDWEIANGFFQNPDAAIDYYSKSLLLNPEDPLVHYASGLAYYRKAEITQSTATLPEARKHFETMLKLNSELAQAQTARKYIATINATLSSQ